MKNAKSNASIAKQNAWKYFEAHGFRSHKGMVLHHVNTAMKYDDPVRYNQWLVKDLQVMTRQEHRSLHMQLEMAGKKHTVDHNRAISDGLANSEILKGGKFVKIHMPPREEQTLYFSSYAEAAKYIGCTRQLVSQVLQKHQTNKNKKAMGWDVSLVEL